MKKNATDSGMKSHTTSHKVATSSRKTRIYKRSERGGWNYKAKVEGKVRYFPLGLDRKAALDLADQIRGHLMLHPFEEVQKMFQKKAFAKVKDPVPTLGKLWELYESFAISNCLSKNTIKDYKDAIYSVFRKVLGTRDVDTFLVNKLDFHFWMEYKRLKLEKLTDQGKIASCMRTINSKIAKISALGKQPKVYEGWDIGFFKEVKDFDKFTGLGQQYKLPATALIERTFELWENSTGDMYTLLGLVLHFGLRRNEAFHARADWFNMTSDIARITVERELDFRPKGGHEGFTQGSKAVAASILNKASGGVYLIKTRADAGRTLYDPTLDALRKIGWDRNLPLHECRKLFASFISTTVSVYTSQKFMRHASVETTSKSYSDLITDPKILDFWKAA
tara:strand:+ start:1366 stop:2544 length:1179 start_codon:yes stop_codon:yes gene_type:complete